MIFGFDIDGTITAAPKQFAALTHALHAAGHEVAILTGTMDTEVSVTHNIRRTRQLEELGIHYDYLEIVHAPHHVQAKADFCKRYGVVMMFEDSPEYAKAINEAGTLCVLMPLT